MWLPAVSFSTGPDWEQDVTLTANVPAAGIASVAFALDTSSDLARAGGEGAKIARVVGRLFFSRLGSTSLGGQQGFLRAAVITRNVDGATGTIIHPNLFTGPGLGNEDIMWSSEFFVPDINLGTSANGPALVGAGAGPWFKDIDIKVKRKFADEQQIVLILQTTQHLGGTIPTHVAAGGFLRILAQKVR